LPEFCSYLPHDSFVETKVIHFSRCLFFEISRKKTNHSSPCPLLVEEGHGGGEATVQKDIRH